jgi:membrane protease YdiL (CAAX protease family)
MPALSGPRPVVSAVVFCTAAAVVAIPVAWVVAAAGFGMAIGEPKRDLISLALWSVGEEIVFRGALQPTLARRIDGGATLGITHANAVTSVVFAALHVWRHPLLVAILVFPVSLVYGKARELSGRVWPAALLHVTFNACLYASSWLHAGA